MEANVLIISDNQVSVDFWYNNIQEDLRPNVLVSKTSSLADIHHLVSSYSVVILDDYFTNPVDDTKIIEKVLKIKRINVRCKVFAISPVYADKQQRAKELIVSFQRDVFSIEFLESLNEAISNSFNQLQKIAI